MAVDLVESSLEAVGLFVSLVRLAKTLGKDCTVSVSLIEELFFG